MAIVPHGATVSAGRQRRTARLRLTAPLRDLEQHWNLDTLYILAQSEASVVPLLQVADAWGCEVGQYTLEQAERLLGTGLPAPIVWAWWD
ncbi:hypothetical protein ACQ4M3_25760 [Leptolyngbya sp. AN03gr2]|uniref:hypothetical protein n=1 Tax=unclassified Leptolyngbya TaxID=2650499 RepID=UPI003D321BF0